MAEIKSPQTPRHESGDALIAAALELADRAHRGQRRKQTGNSFIEHPMKVAEIVSAWTSDPEVIAAAYLHDVLEKTDVNASQLRDQFGETIASTVIVATEDPLIPSYPERKRDLRSKVIDAGRPATVIYAADRVANLRDWNRLDEAQRAEVGTKLGTSFEERLMLWQEDLGELSEADPGLPLLAEIEIELSHLLNP